MTIGKSLYSELSPIDILKVTSEVAGSKESVWDMVLFINPNASLTSPMISWATGVGSMPLEDLIKRSSLNMSLSLDSALLTAGCVIPKIWPALVRFFSV